MEIINGILTPNLETPSQNSTANFFTSDVIGNKTDYVGIPYVSNVNSILAYLSTGYYHVHGRSFVYPTLAADVTLTSGAGAWNVTGAIIEVIPAATALYNFDLHWINVSNISANGTYEIIIYSGLAGAEVVIGSTRPTRNAVQSQEQPRRIQIPQQPAGTRISCKLSDSTASAQTLDVSFEGHYYGV